MRILSSEVPRHVIDAQIVAAAYPGHAPARWALPLLNELDMHGESWHLVELDEKEFADLWLPAHAGEACHGDSMRLGEGEQGASVRGASAWLAANAGAYAAANPSCWGRIAKASAADASPIVVSRSSVGDRVKPAGTGLVVVDGLHRVLGDWMAGRRRGRAYIPGPWQVIRT